MFKKTAWMMGAVLVYAGSVWADSVEVHGSTTVQKHVEKAQSAIKDKTGLEVKYVGNGSKKGVSELMDGKVSVAAISEPLDDVLKDLGKSNNGLKFHEVMKDEIIVGVNKANSVSKLSKDQLIRLFTGKIKNWKEVGGADVAVKVVSGGKGSGTVSAFQKQALDDKEYTSDAIVLKSSKDEAKAVEKEAGAIAALSSSNLGSTKKVETEHVSRPLGFVTKGEPSGDAKKLVDFLTSETGKSAFK